MSNRSEAFGRLLKAGIGSIAMCEGRTAPAIEDELASKVGLAGTAIQRYKSGVLPPDPRTVEVLAEAAVRRGLLSRAWLQQFLHVARYPAPDALLDRLCPPEGARPRPPRIYANLPAPTYSQFVMRDAPFAEVLDGLRQRSAAVLIVGLGGNGKTSLAREVATRCLDATGDAPAFEAAVWVSDKDRPGTTNLSVVLDEVVRTLDYPGFTQFAHDEKQREVENLLRHQRVLLVVDNAETITDGALLDWLLRLPEPSKAVLTTREYLRAYRRGGWPVELRGMDESEARALVAQRLRALRMERLVSEEAQLEPLVAVTGGNPKAISLALGLVKHERRPLLQVVDDLHAACGEIFDDLFTRAWGLLDEAARRVLLAMPLFPDSASEEALSATADVSGYAFARAAERLADLALLDVEQRDLNASPRYALHALVRTFAKAKLAVDAPFAEAARRRWRYFFRAFAQQFSTGGWGMRHQFEVLDQELPSLHALLEDYAASKEWDEVIDGVFTLNQFWSTWGYYQHRDRFVEFALRAAEVEGKVDAQIRLLAIKVRTLCYLDNPDAAAVSSQKARALLAELPIADGQREIDVNYSQVRVCMLTGDLETMRVLVERNIALAASEHIRHIHCYDLAEYLFRANELERARHLLEQLMAQSTELNDQPGLLKAWLLLARIDLQRGQVHSTELYLKRAQQQAEALRHRRYLADVSKAWAQYHLLRGDQVAARAAYLDAADRYERLGMRHECAVAQAALVSLEEVA